MVSHAQHTRFVKEEAARLGFSYCGISKAAFLEKEAPRLERYLRENMNGKMAYLANHFDKRLDPAQLVLGTKSVVLLLYNYYPEKRQNPDAPKIGTKLGEVRKTWSKFSQPFYAFFEKILRY